MEVESCDENSAQLSQSQDQDQENLCIERRSNLININFSQESTQMELVSIGEPIEDQMLLNSLTQA